MLIFFIQFVIGYVKRIKLERTYIVTSMMEVYENLYANVRDNLSMMESYPFFCVLFASIYSHDSFVIVKCAHQ